jgi:DNA invertase Pin-like site-specific DNA recombinase
MESKVDFVAVDQPTQQPFMLHLQAAFAEEEARRISQRTKEALAAAKRRGVKVGITGQVLAARHKADLTQRTQRGFMLFRAREEGFNMTMKTRSLLVLPLDVIGKGLTWDKLVGSEDALPA